MTLRAVIEQYSHLDIVLGDAAWCADSVSWNVAHDLWEAAKKGNAEIDRLQRELAEARAYISTIIDAPKDYPAEEGM